MENNDAQLVHRILDGDENAFSEIVKKISEAGSRVVWQKIGDFHKAEDITQETFLKVYEILGKLKDPQRFESWLMVIAKNHCSGGYEKDI